MIVDTIFVIVLAGLVNSGTEVKSKTYDFQTLEQCRAKLADLNTQYETQIKPNETYKGIKFFLSECTPVPVTELK